MIAVYASGHQQLSGLKALLELFAGKSRPSAALLDGEALNGFAADSDKNLIFLSELDEKNLSLFLLREGEEGTLRRAQNLESCPRAVDLKRQIKRQFYRGLSDLTGIEWPWGSLTGIRPTYIAAELLREHTAEEAKRILLEDYRLKEEKAELALFMAGAEEAIMAGLPERAYAAYIGIPFCPSRCAYCSFTTPESVLKDESAEEAFMDYLERDIDYFLNYAPRLNRSLEALYIGGGTPAALSEKNFRRLLELARRLPLSPHAEITVEAGRADVMNEAKVRALADAGIERICLNPQTLNEETLRRVGRRGSIRELKNIYDLARAYGIKSINLDLIAGLDSDVTELLSHVEKLISWEPESITLHTLALKRGSAYDLSLREAGKEQRIRPEPQLEKVLYEAQQRLRRAGYAPYYLYRQKYGRSGLENTAFAKKGHACVYNIMMMSDRYPVAGFGSPSMSKAFAGGRLKRLASPKSLSACLKSGSRFQEKKAALLQAETAGGEG